MKFGKIQDISAVDFSLPPDPPATRGLLESVGKMAGSLRIRMGTTGWGNKEWVGKWYPKGSKAADYLRHYSRQFATIEFNSTHYRIPTEAMIQGWYDKAAEGFRFCPKVPQQISHRARLHAPEATERFVHAIRGLGEKLGPVFIQLPEHFDPRKAGLIRSFVADWPADIPLHWEFRHPDWFGDSSAAWEIFELLREAGHGMCLTDVAGRRDVLNMLLTTPVLMLRFVGNGMHPTDYQRADAWAEKIREWGEMGLREAYLFIHQPEMEQVPEYTAYWVKALQKATRQEVLLPRPTAESAQGKLF